MSEELKAQFPDEWSVFSALDVDGSGGLDKDELWCKLASVGEEQATQLIEMVDKNGDGQVDFEEFCDAFANVAVFKELVSATKQSAFVFCKPHANTEAVQQLVRDIFAHVSVAITSEGEISGEVIDEKKYIDQHYYAIASKATLMKPAELNVPADKFAAEFGEEVRAKTAPQFSFWWLCWRGGGRLDPRCRCCGAVVDGAGRGSRL
jgi:hypothetical protein